MEFNIDAVCELLTQKGIAWNKIQDERIVVWTDGNLDKTHKDLVELLLIYKLYLIDTGYSLKHDMTTTVFMRK